MENDCKKPKIFEKFLQKATFGPVFLFPGAQSQRPAGHGPQMVTGGPPGVPARGDCYKRHIDQIKWIGYEKNEGGEILGLQCPY